MLSIVESEKGVFENAKGLKRGEVKTDLVGQKIGCMTVLDEYKRIYTNYGTEIEWKCRCDCGNEKYIRRGSLLRGKFLYCEDCRPQGIRHSKLYHIYHGIKQRCYNPNAPGWEYYGGKGIKMCKQWLDSYDTFQDWSIKNGYVPDAGLSIDRIDSDRDYDPDNCQWIPLGENSARSNYGRQQVFTKMTDLYAISPDGEKIPITNISKFSRDYNLNISSVGASLRGWRNNTYKGWVFHSNRSQQ